MLCSWTQWQISREVDLGQPLGATAARHLRRCPECRRFREQVGVMEAVLRTPPDVGGCAAGPVSAGGRKVGGRWVAAAAALVVVGAVGLWLAVLTPKADEPWRPQLSDFFSPTSVFAALVENDDMGDLHIVSEARLSDEIASLTEEASGAVRFLWSTLTLPGSTASTDVDEG